MAHILFSFCFSYFPPKQSDGQRSSVFIPLLVPGSFTERFFSLPSIFTVVSFQEAPGHISHVYARVSYGGWVCACVYICGHAGSLAALYVQGWGVSLNCLPASPHSTITRPRLFTLPLAGPWNSAHAHIHSVSHTHTHKVDWHGHQTRFLLMSQCILSQMNGKWKAGIKTF